MRTKDDLRILERGGSIRATNSRRDSSTEHERRLGALRNEVSGELLRRRLLSFIKYEQQLGQTPSANLKEDIANKASTPQECVANVPQGQYPVPAFPPVEASVDLSSYHHTDLDENEDLCRDGGNFESGIQLIMTPLQQISGQVVEVPPAAESNRNITPRTAVTPVIVQSRMENRQAYYEVVFIDEDSTSCETLSSGSDSEYGETP